MFTVYAPVSIYGGIRKYSLDMPSKFLGEEYQDYNLVLTLPNGRPCDERLIHKAFAELKERAQLPNVVFHSLRHPYVKLMTKKLTFNIKALSLNVLIRDSAKIHLTIQTNRIGTISVTYLITCLQ